MDQVKPDWKRYIEQQGLKCPYCASVSLHGGVFDADGGYAWRTITCGGCGRTWGDVYRLVDVDLPENKDKDDGKEDDGSPGAGD